MQDSQFQPGPAWKSSFGSGWLFFYVYDELTYFFIALGVLLFDFDKSRAKVLGVCLYALAFSATILLTSSDPSTNCSLHFTLFDKSFSFSLLGSFKELPFYRLAYALELL